jgi:outer membrane protein OmpA-like peptidoglycan-associated protein
MKDEKKQICARCGRLSAIDTTANGLAWLNFCDYCRQAGVFLTHNNLMLKITLSDSKSANWKPAGHHYRVTLSRASQYVIPSGTMAQLAGRKRMTFDFWDSVHNMGNNIKPSPYDILACVSSDVACSDTFEDFCSDFGYDTDSLKALQTYRKLDRFAKRLREFLTVEEIEQLQEIS